MRPLAAETGGACFEVTKEEPIEQIYCQIEETVRDQYSVGYTVQTRDGHSKRALDRPGGLSYVNLTRRPWDMGVMQIAPLTFFKLM
jgi:hypothetical protein